MLRQLHSFMARNELYSLPLKYVLCLCRTIDSGRFSRTLPISPLSGRQSRIYLLRHKQAIVLPSVIAIRIALARGDKTTGDVENNRFPERSRLNMQARQASRLASAGR